MKLDHALIDKQAKYARIEYISDLIARFFVWVDQKLTYHPVPPLADNSTKEDIIRYANSIRATQPGYADDLIAAVNRAS